MVSAHEGHRPVADGPGDRAAAFEAERPRLVALAARVLSDRSEAEDVVQQTWLRLARQDVYPDNLAAWLTTVTTRLCLDRLRKHRPVLLGEMTSSAPPAGQRSGDEDAWRSPPADIEDDVVLAETVGVALQAVLDRLSPAERVAFVLHDSFGFEFPTIAAILDTTDGAARKLASRARAKVRQPSPQDALADWEVVDAFLSAARGGDLSRLVDLLAPDVRVRADPAAITMGTPAHIDGRDEVAAFFNGAAKAARAVSIDGRPGASWFQAGAAKVLFDFVVADGVVTSITFRAEEALLARVVRRDGPPAPP